MTYAVTDNVLSCLVLSFTPASWKLTAKRYISCVKQPSRVEVESLWMFLHLRSSATWIRWDSLWVIRTVKEGQVCSIAHYTDPDQPLRRTSGRSV